MRQLALAGALCGSEHTVEINAMVRSQRNLDRLDRIETSVAHDRFEGRLGCHRLAAMVTGYANRRRFAAVEYRDANQVFCPGFPWFRLRELLREKCDAWGLAFEHASSDPSPKSQGPFAPE